MLSNPWVRLGLVLGAAWAGYKYGPNPTVKTAALSIGAIVAAKQIPFVKDYV
ncbi:MAG: hypothetical protein ACK52V_16135 [Betaproteobacteria bacterium]|jgi:hypothetical protein